MIGAGTTRLFAPFPPAFSLFAPLLLEPFALSTATTLCCEPTSPPGFVPNRLAPQTAKITSEATVTRPNPPTRPTQNVAR